MGGCERVKLELHSPSSLASGQLWAVREGGQSLYSRTLCRNAGKCVTHADPASDRQRDARAGSLRSPSLPHHGYVSGFVGVTSTKPSPRGQTFHSFGQECPWNRSPGTLWFTQTPPPRAGGPRSTGMQCRGVGRAPNCTGT